MAEFIPLRTARGRIEAKLLVDHGVSIEHPIALGAHPLIEHLLSHGTVRSSRHAPWDLGAWRPVKGCKLCALLKAHQLLSDAIAEDEELQEPREKFFPYERHGRVFTFCLSPAPCDCPDCVRHE